MVALALDIGETRIGIAASDSSGRLAMPVKVLPASEVTGMARSFRYVLEDHEPDVLVCGLPKTLAGEDGQQAERVRAVAAEVAEACGLPVEFVDERLSSAEAKRILRAQGLSERQMRGRVDMVAASLFLQAWLDARRDAEAGLQG
ncbi:Holliday junction resolvase RuvX [Enorma burkinafasonensis]|uniref:Holliday junction resolvase RuvX n=1 Tax=Enorma burkinafasonensis TaxID=2590867 RepID=UPI00119EEE10|nr:Holliday junction resolvase RuvX [Enorma burkinafasonensis]